MTQIKQARVGPHFQSQRQAAMRSFLESHNAARRDAYRKLPGDLKEHYGIEQTVLAGGYGYRQVMELIQNGADAILEAYETGMAPTNANRIHVLLRGSFLYVANTGAPLSEEGVEALLSSHSSPKRGNQIGRFGLGFKSLLRLGGRIDLFANTSGAIRFDPDRCRRELQEEFGATDTPGLRLAWPLDDTERTSDPVLDEFAWAETIVRVEIRSPGFVEHLRSEVHTFPAEFLLFLPVPVTLHLDDGAGPEQKLRVETRGLERVLLVGAEKSRWRVVTHDVSITDDRARADATHIHARASVPLAWAIPLEGKREEAGRFWAFFPTHTPTYLPGILNAPWKLNSDRNAIIGGEWNTALMVEAAHLIVKTLADLRTDQDPGRPLDSFPRQLERKDEDAAPLVEAVWTALDSAFVVPDTTGALRLGRELWRHPRDNAGLARNWQLLAGDDEVTHMVHPSCLERQRGSRLNELAERLKLKGPEERPRPNLRKREAPSWFSAIAVADVQSAIQVLKLAEAYQTDCKSGEWSSIRPQLAIIPSDEGQLLTANQAVFAPEGMHVPDGRHPVARALHEDAEGKRILADVMKVKQLDDSVWEAALCEAMPHQWGSPPDDHWRSFWELLRSAPETVRQQFVVRNSSRICIRRRDGKWVLRDEVLLPGTLVSSDDSANQKVLFDADIHGSDEELLQSIGVTDAPNGVIGSGSYDTVVQSQHLLFPWLTEWRMRYRRQLDSHQNPQEAYLKPLSIALPRSWMLLSELSGIPNAKFTHSLSSFVQDDSLSRPVSFGHVTRGEAYRPIEIGHPLGWFLLKHGSVQFGARTARLPAIVARRHEPALTKLPNWDELQPALEKLDGANPAVTATEAEIRDMWLALINALATPAALADDSLRELWRGAAKDGVVPDSLLTEAGKLLLCQVFVSGSPDLARRTRTPDRIVVILDEHALRLWLERGARNLADLISPQWTQPSGPAALLVSTVPELVDVLRDDVMENARSQSMSGLKLVIDGEATPAPCLMWENTLLLDLEQLDLLSRSDRLQCLLAEVAAAGWLKDKPDEALSILGDAQMEGLRAHVAQGSSLAERLLRAVGNRPEPLRQALGGLANMDFIQQCQPLRLAELTLAHRGPATLTALKEILSDEGLKPPSRWGTVQARAFVASIGFPEEFAASPEERRESEVIVSGPIELPPLHDFQVEVLDGIRALIASSASRRRAVVSLPTGGGKTRVTVEAAVQLVLTPEGNRQCVIWVAQTDELCEQAVQAFRQVWVNRGAQRTDLRIIRLWGGNPAPSIQELDKPVVVVASIQTLNSRMWTAGLEWLQNPGLVIVDECHHAITPSYTNLLRWLDAEAPRPISVPKDEPPIIGLSATPFRTDDDESRRLARRFDNTWLPSDQQNLHVRLREKGVLALVESEPFESGIFLPEDQVELLLHLLDKGEGIDFDRQLEVLNQLLAENKERNQRLVDFIKAANESSILFFANSVLHAEEMSARLNLEGITAAAGKLAGAKEGVVSGPVKLDTSPFMIGQRKIGFGGSLEAINGKIDEMQLYGSALTPGEVGFLHSHPEFAIDDDSYVIGSLKLLVDTDSGEVSIVNVGSEPTQLKGYSIISNRGLLSVGNWHSLQNNSDSQLAGWEEANPTVYALSELKPVGSLSVSAATRLTLGHPVTSVAGPEFGRAVRNTDYAFEYVVADGSVMQGAVEFVGHLSVNNLTIDVDPKTGTAVLSNISNKTVRIRGYSVLSESGSLLPEDGQWLSLSDQSLPGVDEANANVNGLSELVPIAGDAVTLSPGQSYSLGTLFQTMAAGGEEDLQFEFFMEQSAPLTGDFNEDGAVNAADYTVWRSKLGSNSLLPNETATLGQVTGEDYQTWRAHFGQNSNVELVMRRGVVRYRATVTGAAASVLVPEPSAVAMYALLIAFVSMLRLPII